jgi:hypothetical protein
MPPLLTPLPTPNIAVDSVPDSLFRRHLGLPACAELDERLTELAGQARGWYKENGSPWNDARQIGIHQIRGDVTVLESGAELHSVLLADGLARANAHSLVVVAATAGATVDRRIDELWRSDLPDEAMYLNAYAIAVVEHLRRQSSDHLRQIAHCQGVALLPHYSPGYEGWDLSDQEDVVRLVLSGTADSAAPMRVLPSGGLWPSKSIVAVYGVAERIDVVEHPNDYWSRRSDATPVENRSTTEYAFSEKALSLWTRKRLQLKFQPNHKLAARFRFEGSTCNNLGVPLIFDYHVGLERDADNGYRITRCSCRPADVDIGCGSMCAYLDNPIEYMAQMESYKPLAGLSLSDALNWNPSVSQAGCLCTRASQDHKWRIVLQTIHYALTNHD